MAKQTQTIEELFELGAHLGHQKSRMHPKAKKQVYKIINGTSIIDLTVTVDQIKKAKDVLKHAASEGKVILVVATKKVANKFIAEIASEKNIPYITSKWMPGLLTNFDMLMKNVHKYKTLVEERDNGAWDEFVKHERTKKGKEISRLERLYKGLVLLKKLPDYVVVVDARKEKNAIEEAKQFNIPVIGLIDTNSNPEVITYPILANDDAAQVVERIMTDLLETYADAKVEIVEETKEAEPVPATA
ncbi:MAG: 30S ribosomal protein S2 [Weeksellaceae bacterium]